MEWGDAPPRATPLFQVILSPKFKIENYELRRGGDVLLEIKRGGVPMDAMFWASVIFAIVVAGGGTLSGLVLTVASIRAGRGPVATLVSATGLCFVATILMALLIRDAIVFV
ncbi:MAG: hypothetical protein WD889_02675 [Candidatus Colwellbacteria bacterium]